MVKQSSFASAMAAFTSAMVASHSFSSPPSSLPGREGGLPPAGGFSNFDPSDSSTVPPIVASTAFTASSSPDPASGASPHHFTA